MNRAPEPVSGAAESIVASGRTRRVRSTPALIGLRARSERSLIAGALAGSQAALEALFQRHWLRAYRAAFLIVRDHAAAEDISQEAFLAAIRHLDRFDRHRRFGPWLSAIVTSRAIDCTRARAARHEAWQEPDEPAAGDPVPPSHTAAEGYSPQLLAALRTLSVEHRAVVVMRYVLEYTPGEIAQALELPRGTVNSRLRRGLDALEASLREDERS